MTLGIDEEAEGFNSLASRLGLQVSVGVLQKPKNAGIPAGCIICDLSHLQTFYTDFKQIINMLNNYPGNIFLEFLVPVFRGFYNTAVTGETMNHAMSNSASST